ncbi:MAG: deoxyribonuclease IV [Planctomycetes bacterium]|nr:deoxyribonuclease IV [Planctomycetota bacterium]
MQRLFGAHLSIAGGCHNAIEKAVSYGMTTVQLFTKNSNQWLGKALTDDDIAIFRKMLKASGLKYPTAHDSYLINLASPDETLYRRSIEAFVDEVERAERLGLSYLVTHPGALMGASEEDGLKRVAQAIDETHARTPSFKVKILLEATAGQGSTLGYRFEHLASIIGQVDDAKRLGVCIDTCHIFAAGYALGTRSEYEATMNEFDRIVGLKRLKLFHLNDSKKPFGSRVDRHEHLGQGCLGLEPFRMIVQDSKFQKLPMILETPKESDENPDMDSINLGILRDLAAEG